MRRHKNLIPFSRQHHHMLVLAQVLKSDVPDYKNMPSTLTEKLEFLNLKLKNLIIPNIKLHRVNLYPSLVEWQFSDLSLVQELSDLEHDLVESIMGSFDADEELLDVIGQKLEYLIRKKERVLYQKIQEECSQELDDLKLEDVST